MPLLSWDIYIQQYFKSLRHFEKQTELADLINLSKKFRWETDLNSMINDNDYEAIVVTDKDQNIIYVNSGFTEMTGYSKKFALKKKPSFLQGKATSEKTKEQIRKHLKEDIPFKEVLINYKKDKTPYKCEVQIIPLFSKNTTHYIALERQVS